MENPVITTCCGRSGCLKCVVDFILEVSGSSEDTKCCFCKKPIDIRPSTAVGEADPSKYKLLSNKNLRRLLKSQIK
jgi:hypothetical protein